MTIDRMKAEPLPRCCSSHTDWESLRSHLLSGFRDVPLEVVEAELAKARVAIHAFAISGTEAIEIAELITRHQLLIHTGQLPDIAKLDPQVHIRGGGPDDGDSAEEPAPSYPSEQQWSW